MAAALDPNVAAVRTAVRRALRPYAPHAYQAGTPTGLPSTAPCLLVACSGGADSSALAAATAFVAPRMGLRAGLVTVDHGLQPGSAQRAAALAGWARGAGLEPVLVCPVDVAEGSGGPEAAAREVRYRALVAAARAVAASAVLLGHTRDDQAETVLLALVRGAGLRGLAGMPATRTIDGVTFVRPLLGVARTETQGACAALGLTPWQDPHNHDPAFTRTHARQLLADLAERLGPGVIDNLARTADHAAAGIEVIDQLARDAELEATDPTGALWIEALRARPTAVRRAVLRAWVRGHGVPGGALSHGHVEALDALIVGWRGQRGVSLPGGYVATRRGDHLHLAVAPPPRTAGQGIGQS